MSECELENRSACKAANLSSGGKPAKGLRDKAREARELRRMSDTTNGPARDP